MDAVVETTSSWAVVNRILRPIALLGLASVVAGAIIGGIGGRVVMTVSARAAGPDFAGRITENGNVVGEFTVDGTLTLIIFAGLLGGMLASVAVVASDPWLRWMGRFKGLGFGVVVLTVYGYDTFASIDFFILEPVLLNVLMFVGLILGFGVGLVGFARILDRRLPEASDGEQVGWLLVVGLGGLPLFMSVLFFASESFCGCEPASEIGASLMVMVLSTAAYHVSNATSLISGRWIHVVALLGYSSLAAAVYFGSVRIVDALQRLF